MHSDWSPWRVLRLSPYLLLISGAVMPQCEGQDNRLDDICSTLSDCSNYIDSDSCTNQLEDALEDDRLTPSAITRCARCLVNNNDAPEDDTRTDSPGSCKSLLRERDCDAACREIMLVQNARTTGVFRTDACTRLADACGMADCNGDPFVKPEDASNEVLEALDAKVEECTTCIVAVPPSQPTEASSGGVGGGAGRGGSGGSGGMQPTKVVADSERCERIIELCSAACVSVPAIDRRLTIAAAAHAYCETPAACPIPPSATDGSRGGSGGTMTSTSGGTGGSKPGCKICPQADDCLRKALKATSDEVDGDSTMPGECLRCVKANACSDTCNCTEVFR